MDTVQFQAKIKNGKIDIPRQYWKRFNEQVRVILVAAEERNIQGGIIDKFLTDPVKLADFQPLSRDDAHVR